MRQLLMAGDPWVRGAYCIPQATQLLKWKGRIAEPEGRLFFAGEHTSEYSAWIEGGVRSGYRARARSMTRRSAGDDLTKLEVGALCR
ncbi:MAG: FAD-dependent oxidoreductase [Bradyrhizobium sp.]